MNITSFSAMPTPEEATSPNTFHKSQNHQIRDFCAHTQQGNGQSKAYHRLGELAVIAHIGSCDGKRQLFFHHQKAKKNADCLCQNGCNRCTSASHVQQVDEEIISNDIGDTRHPNK